MPFTQVTVTGTFQAAEGGPATGRVRFTPSDARGRPLALRNGEILVATPTIATLNGAGTISVSLAATDDTGTEPVGAGYRVDELITGQLRRTYVIIVPHTPGTLDLADIVPATPGPALVQYLTQATADARYALSGAGGDAVLDADLTAIAALTPTNNDLLQRKSGAWTNRTPDQVKTDLALAKGDVGLGSVDNVAAASLRDRTSHTGVQAISTVTGLQTALDAKAATTDVPELARDALGTALVAGANVTITPNDGADTITIAAATSGSSGIPAATVDAKGDLIAGTADDTVARLGVGSDGQVLTASAAATTGLAWAAASSTPADASVTNVKVASGAAITLDKTADATASTGRLAMTNAERTKLSGVATAATANSSDAALRDRSTHTGTQLASTVSDFTEAAQDATATLLTGGSHTGVSAAYVDASNRVDLTVTGGVATPTAHPTDAALYSFGATTGTAATAPGAPTIGAVTAGPGQVTVAFTAPASNGGAAVSSYTATSTPGSFTGSGPSSPIVVSGLVNGTAYTFKVKATNSAGTGAESAASASATPAASGAPVVTPGTSTPARWWIPFGGAPHCRVTWETGVVSGSAQVVWVASMPDVRARTTKLETGVAAQTQDAWQAYIQDLSTGLTVADSGTVLGTAAAWTAPFTPVTGRRYKGFARVRAADGQWSPYSGTRFVAPTGTIRFFEDFGMVGDDTTRSGNDYGASLYDGPLWSAVRACQPGDVLKSSTPGTTITGVTVSGTTITAASGAFTGRAGQNIFIYKAGTTTGSSDSYGHRTTIASVAGGGGSATLTVAPATNIAAAAGTALVNYPVFWVGHLDVDGGLASQGGWTLDGTGCMFTSHDADSAGFRTTIPDITYKNVHYRTTSTHTRGNGLNNNTGPFFIEGTGAVGIRLIGCVAEHARDAGYLFYGAGGGGPSDCHVVDCWSDHTMADPFHVTGTASDIQFIRPTSVFCGDDGVANIGYRADGDSARPQRITWEAPTVIGQDWGRGLSFGGSKDCLATDVTISNGAMAAFIIGSDGDMANTEHVQVRRFTVTNPKAKVGTHPTYSQGSGTGSTIVDDAPIKLLNSGSLVRQRDILIEDGTITDPGWSVQAVVYSGGEFQDGTIIIRGVTLAGTVTSGLGWLDQATYPNHLDFRGIAVPAGSTAASAPTGANS